MRGFTLIEILIAFAITGVVAGIGINSFVAYNRSQAFTQGVSDVADLMGVARSRAISQVKPQVCGADPLLGYEVRAVIAGTDYILNVRCGSRVLELSRKKLSGQLTFLSGSSQSIMFNVSTGTVNIPGGFIISGYGRSKSVNVEQSGKITLTDGAAVVIPTATPTPPLVADGCTAPAYSLINGTWCVFMGAGNGEYCTANCGSVTTPGPSGAGCSKDYYWSPPYCVLVGGNRGNYCDSSCGGQSAGGPTPTSAPTQATQPTAIPTTPVTTAPPLPTATPTTSPGNTSSSIAFSISPNPAASSQSVTFSATVTGTNCIPSGRVDFYRDNQPSRFAAIALVSGSNPGSGSIAYPASQIGAGTHPVYAQFVPASSTCPARISSTINLVIQ